MKYENYNCQHTWQTTLMLIEATEQLKVKVV